MSIVAYTGLPGSGKSYGVVENVVLPALKSGRHIVTNLALKVGTLTDDYPKGRITTFDTQDTSWTFDLEQFPGALWIIDEAHHYWPGGLKMNAVSTQTKAFFTEHRHSVGSDGRSAEIVLVTQDLAQVAAFARNLVEDTYRASKLTALGMSKKFRVDVFQGCATGSKPTGHYRQLFGVYKPEVFKYYRSHTKNKTDFAAGMEEKTDDRANIWKSPFIRFGVPAAILLVIFSLRGVVGYFTGGDQKKNESDTAPQQQSQPQPGKAFPLTQRADVSPEKKFVRFDLEVDKPKLSDTWRIVGDINGQFILQSENGTRQIKKNRCLRDPVTLEDMCIVSGLRVTWYSSKVHDDTQHYSALEDAKGSL